MNELSSYTLDEEQTDKLLGILDDVIVIRKFFRPQSSGWSYRITINQNGKSLDILPMSNNLFIINHKDYTVIKYSDSLYNFCKSIAGR